MRLLAAVGIAVAGQAAALPLPLGDEFRVSVYTASGHEAPVLAANPGGPFVVVWHAEGGDGSSRGILARRYDDPTTAAGPVFLVNSYTPLSQRDPAIAMDASGEFLIVWSGEARDRSGWGIFGQRHASDGTRLGTEFQVNTYTTGSQGFADVAAQPGGGFVVVWQSLGQDGASYGIFGQRFDSDGAHAGSEFAVNVVTANRQDSAAVAATDSGFVVAWDSNVSTSMAEGVARRFDHDGTPLSGEFRLSEFGGSHGFPTLAPLPGGEWLAAWIGDRDGDDWGVFARRFDAGGEPLGGAFQVNSYTIGHQFEPVIAGEPDGDFVIAWTTTGQDGWGYAVAAKRFAGTGAPQSAEFLVNTFTISHQWHPAVGVDALGATAFVWYSQGQVVARAFAECGDGIPLAPAEACDDGNAGAGDCCSPHCAAEPAGQQCADDGLPCTVDACDGAGACGRTAGHAGVECRAAVGACDVAEQCPGDLPACPPDQKSLAICRPVAGVCDVAEACDGTSDACAADAGVPDGSGCADGLFCNGDEVCADRACGAGVAPCGGDCDETADRCVARCPASPAACRDAEGGKLRLLQRADAARSRLVWRWSRGTATAPTDFGDPTAGTGYALCFYAGGSPLGIGDAEIAAAPARWHRLASGFAYRNTAAADDGIESLVLKAGDAGRAKITLKGRGAGLPMPPLPVANLPLLVQLHASDSDACWETRFDAADVQRNDGQQLKATRR